MNKIKYKDKMSFKNYDDYPDFRNFNNYKASVYRSALSVLYLNTDDEKIKDFLTDVFDFVEENEKVFCKRNKIKYQRIE